MEGNWSTLGGRSPLSGRAQSHLPAPTLVRRALKAPRENVVECVIAAGTSPQHVQPQYSHENVFEVSVMRHWKESNSVPGFFFLLLTQGYDFTDLERDRGRGRETHIHQLLPYVRQIRDRTCKLVCALTRSRTRGPSVHRIMLNQLSHKGQCLFLLFLMFYITA